MGSAVLPQSPVEQILRQAAPGAAAGAAQAGATPPPQVPPTPADTAPPAPATAPAAPGTPAPGSDPVLAMADLMGRAEQNPYASQIGQLTEQLRGTQAVNQQLETAMVTQWIAGLPEEERPRARAGYKLVQGMRDMAFALQSRERYAQGLEEAVLPLIRMEALRQTSQKEGVPLEVLSLAQDPNQVPILVALYKNLSQRFSANARVEAKVDGVPPPGSSAGGGPVNTSEVSRKYAKTGDLASWYSEVSQAR